jgi:hypothetical protein
VNSALWWKPHPSDWNVNFPTGWKNDDMKGLMDKVWDLIPGVGVHRCRDLDRANASQRHTIPLETANSTYSKALIPYRRA